MHAQFLLRKFYNIANLLIIVNKTCLMEVSALPNEPNFCLAKSTCYVYVKSLANGFA
jgi:hypothetical protein